MVDSSASRGMPEKIAEAVRQSIFTGELQPGDPIAELHWARRHGVSQATVRDAFARLEHSGLVRRVRNKGTFVTNLSPQDVSEYLRLRVILERVAVADAARLAAPEKLKNAERRLQAIGAAVQANDYFQASQADLAFHRALWEISGDRTLYRMLDQITVPLFAFTSMRRSRSHEDLTRVMRSHAPILAAIKKNDAQAAQEAIRAHVELSYLEFLNGPQAAVVGK